jgi:hypothetical protein
MARHKLTIEQRLKGARKLVNSPKVNAGLKAWAKKIIAKHGAILLVLAGALALGGCAVLQKAQSAPVNKTITEVIADAGAVANSAEQMYNAGTIPQTAGARTAINDLGNAYNLAKDAWVMVLKAESAYNAAVAAQLSACAPTSSGAANTTGCTAATTNAKTAKTNSDAKTVALQTQVSVLVAKTSNVKALAGAK